MLKFITGYKILQIQGSHHFVTPDVRIDSQEEMIEQTEEYLKNVHPEAEGDIYAPVLSALDLQLREFDI